MNAAFGLRADFLAAGFLAAFLAGILGFSSWNGPPLLPKTGRTLTEDARPSKALSPSGDRLRALGPTTEPRTLSSPLRPGNAQDAGPFAPENHRGARGRGGRKPLPRLLLRGEHQRLSAGREQPPRLEQLAREHRFAGRRRRLAQDETSAALRQRFRGKERLDHAQPVTAQAQRSGVAPEEGGLEEIAVLRDDLRLRPADSRGERQRAVAAAEGEHGAGSGARRGVEQSAQGLSVAGILARVARPREDEDALRGGVEARLVTHVDRFVVEPEARGPGRDRVDEVVLAGGGEPRSRDPGSLDLFAQVADDDRPQLSAGREQRAARLEEIGDAARADPGRHVAEHEVEPRRFRQIAVAQAR